MVHHGEVHGVTVQRMKNMIFTHIAMRSAANKEASLHTVPVHVNKRGENNEKSHELNAISNNISI